MNCLKHACAVLTLLVVVSVAGVARMAAQGTEDKAIVNPSTSDKFGAIPNAPECFTIVVEKGDPSKGASIILAKFAPGCVAVGLRPSVGGPAAQCP
jgi:hypothetical protein